LGSDHLPDLKSFTDRSISARAVPNILNMKLKDNKKRKALFAATVKIVNKFGFASGTISKIALEAKVSPGTIYVYFKNKEDLLVSIYKEVKLELRDTMLSFFDESLPIRVILKNAWRGLYQYYADNPEFSLFIEQFENSPYNHLVDRETLDMHYDPFVHILERGVEQKIIKDADRKLLFAYMFNPLFHLANPRYNQRLYLNDEEIELAFCMAWDAIKR